jgi:hypothetical protein
MMAIYRGHPVAGNRHFANNQKNAQKTPPAAPYGTSGGLKIGQRLLVKFEDGFRERVGPCHRSERTPVPRLVKVDAVTAYTDCQFEHHHARTFQAEHLGRLANHGVEDDPKYTGG